MASTRGRPNRSAWARRSVGVSTSTTPPSISSFSPGRQRLFLGLSELQTRQGQPITGMPVEVPLPSMVTRKDMGLGILAQADLGVEGGRRHGSLLRPSRVGASDPRLALRLDSITSHLFASMLPVTFQGGFDPSLELSIRGSASAFHHPALSIDV